MEIVKIKFGIVAFANGQEQFRQIYDDKAYAEMVAENMEKQGLFVYRYFIDSAHKVATRTKSF